MPLAGYPYYKALSLVPTLAETVAAPVVIRPGNLTGKVQDDCDDIRILNAAGVEVPYCIESRNAAAPVIHALLSSPASSPGAAMGQIVYGKADAVDGSNAAATFAGYTAAYGLGEASGNFADWTGAYPGVASNIEAYGVAGQVDGAARFNGTTSMVQAGDGTDLNPSPPFTLSLWCNPDSTTEQGYLIDKQNNTTTGFELDWQIIYADELRFRAGNSTARSAAVFVDSGVMVHVAVVLGADLSVLFYRNGLAAGVSSVSAFTSNTTIPLTIGRRQGSTAIAAAFDGILDNVGIHPTAWSATQVEVDWRSGAGTLLAVGAEQVASIRDRRFVNPWAPGLNRRLVC